MEYNLLLIKKLAGLQVLKSPNVVKAFMEVDRAKFVGMQHSGNAYEDRALPIESGQLLSQPAAMALMLELLEVKDGEKVLDVGCGNGWSTALLSKLTGFKGKVVGVEIMPQLIEASINNIRKLDITNAKVVRAEKIIGYIKEAPYDKILVTAESKQIPYELIEQLKDGGILVLPVENDILKVAKLNEDQIRINVFPGYVFPPLININADSKKKTIE